MCVWFKSTDPIQVRLSGGPTINSGRLEVRYNGKWGLVCNDGWGMKDAEVVCRMLDYPGVKELKTTSFSPFNCRSWLVNTGCTGRESSISQCSHNGWKKQLFCMSGKYVVVTCIQHPDEYPSL